MASGFWASAAEEYESALRKLYEIEKNRVGGPDVSADAVVPDDVVTCAGDHECAYKGPKLKVYPSVPRANEQVSLLSEYLGEIRERIGLGLATLAIGKFGVEAFRAMRKGEEFDWTKSMGILDTGKLALLVGLPKSLRHVVGFEHYTLNVGMSLGAVAERLKVVAGDLKAVVDKEGRTFRSDQEEYEKKWKGVRERLRAMAEGTMADLARELKDSETLAQLVQTLQAEANTNTLRTIAERLSGEGKLLVDLERGVPLLFRDVVEQISHCSIMEIQLSAMAKLKLSDVAGTVDTVSTIVLEKDTGEVSAAFVVLYKARNEEFGPGESATENNPFVRIHTPDKAGSSTFLVRRVGTSVSVGKLMHPQLIAYAYAHLGEARARNIISEYCIGPLLMSSCRERLFGVINECFHRALLLRPDYPWARAHLGEVFRTLGNVVANTLPEQADFAQSIRLADYVRAIFYFHDAIFPQSSAHESDYPWAHAHLGAAIINARVFSDWARKKDQPRCIVGLGRYLRIRTCRSGDDEFVDLPEFADKANKHFLRAMETIRVYPWSAVYHSGGVLLKAMMLRESIGEGLDSSEGGSKGNYERMRGCDDLDVMGRVILEQSLYVAPDLLREMFDPQQNWVNAIYETAVVCLRQKRYDDAWEHIVVGLKYPAKDPLLAGVQEVWGCFALVSVALLGRKVGVESGRKVLKDVVADKEDLWMEEKRPEEDGDVLVLLKKIQERPLVRRMERLAEGEVALNQRILQSVSLLWGANLFFRYVEMALGADGSKALETEYQLPAKLSMVVKLKKDYSDKFVAFVKGKDDGGDHEYWTKALGRGTPNPFSVEDLVVSLVFKE